MLHVHRQICGLRSFETLVITQKREGEWPGPRPEVVAKSPLRFVGRAMEKWLGIPWQITGGEARAIHRHAREAAVLHIFFGSTAIRMLPLLRLGGVPTVVSFHGSDVTGEIATPAFESLRREMFERCRLILCRSEQLAERVRALGCEPGKLRLMRTMIPAREWTPRDAPADDAWQIVQACRLVPKKGIETALRAFAIFRRTHPAARFTIAGEGPLEAHLRASALALGIAESVTFAGFLPQPELARLFSESHVFLHPSETVDGDVEGVPNSLLEAMASGLPIVATRHGGIPEVIADGESGILRAEGDVDGLGEALLRLAADPALRERIARAGAESVRREFSEDRQIATLEAHYREAMT